MTRYRFKDTTVPPYGHKRGECYEGEVVSGTASQIKLLNADGTVLGDCALSMLELCDDEPSPPTPDAPA